MSNQDLLVIVLLILAALAFGAETVLSRSLLAGGLFLATLAFLVPLLVK